MIKPLQYLKSRFEKIVLNHEYGLLRLNLIILATASIILVVLGCLWSIFPVKLLNFSIGIYDKEFWASCMSNLHSSLADFTVFTILVSVITMQIDRRKEMQEKAEDKRQRENAQKIEYSRRLEDEFRILEEQKILAKLRANSGKVDATAFFSLLRLAEMEIPASERKRLTANGFDFRSLTLLKSGAAHKFHYFNLSQSRFGSSQFENCSFSNCDLIQILAEDVRLESISFLESNLLDAKFVRAGLERVEFRSTNLKDVDFSLATLRNVKFLDCDLRGVDFSGAHLIKCSFSGGLPTADQMRTAKIEFPVAMGNLPYKDAASFASWLAAN